MRQPRHRVRPCNGLFVITYAMPDDLAAGFMNGDFLPL